MQAQVTRWTKELDGNGKRSMIDIVRELDTLDIPSWKPIVDVFMDQRKGMPEWKVKVDKFIIQRQTLERIVLWLMAPGMVFLVLARIWDLLVRHQ